MKAKAKAKGKAVAPKANAPKKRAGAAAKNAPRAAAKKTASRAKRPAAESGPLDAILAPTAVVYAEEELHILSIAMDHPKLGGGFLDRWTRHPKPGVPKRDLATFRRAMAAVDLDERVAIVAGKLEKAWKMKLDPETRAEVRADVVAMYRGD